MANHPQAFIELNRRFRPLDPKTRPEDEALSSYVFDPLFRDIGLDWSDLLTRHRVVVLGEPGSGKTREFQERSELLQRQGQFAFSIRLDQLANRPLETVLGADLERFRRWRQSGADGTFLLDSVDEAKFHTISDFYAALDSLRNGIGHGRLSRTKILLSSRISEWRPFTDGFEFRRRSPEIRSQSQHVEANGGGADEHPDNPLVVQLEALTPGQVKSLAEATGVSDADLFIQALDSAHAWDFARRPLDVLELAAFWSENRAIGSLTEIIEHDLQSKLRPRPGRDEHPISEQQAREGAEWLGAAAIFSRTFSFGVADELPPGGGAAQFEAFLPANWEPNSCRALSNRALFDGASYGRIRFHHRRTAEYLAARWIAARMVEGCPIQELERLLLGEVSNRKVIRPSLRPVAAWLCSGSAPWNESVRSWVLESGPGLHFNYGDPKVLPFGYRRQVLQTLARLAKDRSHVSIESSHDSLARLADPALAADFAELIKDRTLAIDLRIEVLDIVRHGRLGSCLDAVTSALAAPDESDDLKTHAVAALGALRDTASLKGLLEFAKQRPIIPNRLCAKIVQALYPGAISAKELVHLLAKTELVKEFTTDLPYYLKSHFESEVTPDHASDLLKHLVELAQTPPLCTSGRKTIPVSAQFNWLGDVIPTVLTTLLKKKILRPEEVEVAAGAAFLLGQLRQCGRLRDGHLSDFNSLTAPHPNVRRSYLWRVVSDFREREGKEPTATHELYDYWTVLRPVPQDFGWLVAEISARSAPQDQVIALRLAIDGWDASGRGCSARRRLRRAAHGNASLYEVFASSGLLSIWLPVRRFWWKRVHSTLLKRWWWLGWRDKVQMRWRWLCEQCILLRHLGALSSGKAVGWLAQLTTEAAGDVLHLAASQWSNLKRQRGRLVASAVRRGCKAAWPQFTPPLPHESPERNSIDPRLMVGLTGLQASADDGEMNFTDLSEKDSKLLARYALNELNGFPPWLLDLATVQQTAVAEVLCECAEGEWLFSKDRERSHEVLARLAWSGGPLASLVEPKLLQLLELRDAPNLLILRFVLIILLANKTLAPRLAALGGSRVTTASEVGAKILWLAVLLQTDAMAGVRHLADQLEVLPKEEDVLVRLCATLGAHHRERDLVISDPDYMRPVALRRLIPLVYQHIKLGEDVHHLGAYTPTARDDAQQFRGTLLPMLAKHESVEATEALRELAEDPALANAREYVLRLLDQRLEREADLVPWGPDDLREFAKNHEADPKNDRELFSIATKRLLELKLQVEASENSLRDELHPDHTEAHLRRWLARKLNERSRQRYSVPQEEEIDRRERPDIRIENPKAGFVSVEVKWAHNWTLPQLLDGLEKQLLGQYLRAHNSRHGLYLLGLIGDRRHWENPGTKARLTFEEVVNIISERAESLIQANLRIFGLKVVGIDFRTPAHK